MLGSVGQKVVAKQAAVVTQSFAKALQDELSGGAAPVGSGAASGEPGAAPPPPPVPEPSGGRAKVVRFAMAGAIALALVAALRRLRSR